MILYPVFKRKWFCEKPGCRNWLLKRDLRMSFTALRVIYVVEEEFWENNKIAGDICTFLSETAVIPS